MIFPYTLPTTLKVHGMLKCESTKTEDKETNRKEWIIEIWLDFAQVFTTAKLILFRTSFYNIYSCRPFVGCLYKLETYSPWDFCPSLRKKPKKNWSSSFQLDGLTGVQKSLSTYDFQLDWSLCFDWATPIYLNTPHPPNPIQCGSMLMVIVLLEGEPQSQLSEEFKLIFLSFTVLALHNSFNSDQCCRLCWWKTLSWHDAVITTDGAECKNGICKGTTICFNEYSSHQNISEIIWIWEEVEKTLHSCLCLYEYSG